jgi:hypothetical protein
MRLSLEARSLPEALSNLAKFAADPYTNTITIDTGMLERFAASARELRSAAEDGEDEHV